MVTKGKMWVGASGALILVTLSLIPAAPAAAWGSTPFGENWVWEPHPCSAYSTDAAAGDQLGANTVRLLGDGGSVSVSFRSLTQNNIGTVTGTGTAVTWMAAASGPHIVGGHHICHTGHYTDT